MSGKDWRDWEAMLDADPELKAAWAGYLGQLEEDAALIAQGIRPTGQVMTKAATRVLDQAMRQNPANDDWPRRSDRRGFRLADFGASSMPAIDHVRALIDQAKSDPGAVRELEGVKSCPTTTPFSCPMSTPLKVGSA